MASSRPREKFCMDIKPVASETPTQSEPIPPAAKPRKNIIRWFVMLFVEASYLQKWLDSVNVQRLTPESDSDSLSQKLEKGRNIITTFYPYDFLRTRETRPNQEPDYEAQRTFNLFKHIIFLRTTERDAARLVNSKENLPHPIGLRFYHDTDGSLATVRDNIMEAFINACVDYKGTFRVIPPISGIEALDKVRIEEGPFAGHEALVTRVHQNKGKISLELTIPLINGAANIRMENVQRHQVSILGHESSDAIRTDFIDYTQTHLLAILAHRVKRVKDPKVTTKDVDMLNRLYRYRGHEVEGKSAATHFLALMLICAHLCKDEPGERDLKEKALQKLAEINAKGESRAATDTRTYLWIALYIATGETSYSRLAKQYVQNRQPKSRQLKRFVALIRKGKKV